MPLYEHVLLARQDVPTSQVDAISESVAKIVEEFGGKVTKTEYWGLKTLAYRIQKNRKAHYVLLNIDAPAAAVAEVERKARIHDDIIRFLTVRTDELENGPSAMMRAKDRDVRRPGDRDRGDRDRGGDRGDRGGDRGDRGGDRGDRGSRGERGAPRPPRA